MCSVPGRSTGKKAAASHGERCWEVGQTLPQRFLIRRAILRLARAPGEPGALAQDGPSQVCVEQFGFPQLSVGLPFPSSMPPQLLSRLLHKPAHFRLPPLVPCAAERHKPQSSSKPCKSQKHEPPVATLTFPVVFQELVPSTQPCLSRKDHRASVAERHTDQKAYNKS